MKFSVFTPLWPSADQFASVGIGSLHCASYGRIRRRLIRTVLAQPDINFNQAPTTYHILCVYIVMVLILRIYLFDLFFSAHYKDTRLHRGLFLNTRRPPKHARFTVHDYTCIEITSVGQ